MRIWAKKIETEVAKSAFQRCIKPGAGGEAPDEEGSLHAQIADEIYGFKTKYMQALTAKGLLAFCRCF